MRYQFDIADIKPATLAVTEARVVQSEIPNRIIGLFDIVYKWLAESNVKRIGDNYAIYDQFASGGMRMRVGVPVAEAFAESDLVRCFHLETGRAAHTTHVGPYSELGNANEQLGRFCADQSLGLGGMSWEEYGDWNDDPSKLVTDVYIRLV